MVYSSGNVDYSRIIFWEGFDTEHRTLDDWNTTNFACFNYNNLPDSSDHRNACGNWKDIYKIGVECVQNEIINYEIVGDVLKIKMRGKNNEIVEKEISKGDLINIKE